MRFLRGTMLIARCYSTNSTALKRGYESVVGLEVHAQILAGSKLFSPTGVKFAAPVNTLVSLFDASVPGTLPVLNRSCVETAVSTSMALQCQINLLSTFDRKHYFYSDLPAGFQITQQRQPIAEYGELSFPVIHPGGQVKPYYKTCRIRQLQLEQDSGKSLHDADSEKSLIDLNRAGVALMEIVFQPDLSNGEEAAALVKELSLILLELNACSCRMEEGALRVDANISVNKPGEPLGTRTEVKNLSSLRSLVGAVEFEITRQINLLEEGGTVTNETMAYNAERKQTVPMRDKEVQQDYRFMPEPNLPPLKLIDEEGADSESMTDQVNIAHLRQSKIELPDLTRKNFMETYNLRLELAQTLMTTPGLAKFFNCVMELIPPTYGLRVANVLALQLMEEIYSRNLTVFDIKVKPEQIAEIVTLIETDKITFMTAKDILTLLFNEDNRSPTQIMIDKGWTKISDAKVILEICTKITEENKKTVQKYRANPKQKHVNKLLAQIRRNAEETDTKLDFKQVTETLKKILDET